MPKQTLFLKDMMKKLQRNFKMHKKGIKITDQEGLFKYIASTDYEDVIEHRKKVVTFEDCFFEAIKCHHNDVASFIEYNILKAEKTNSLKYISSDYGEFDNRKKFTKAYEQPYIKRFSIKSEEKNRDLLKKFIFEKNIDLSTHIKKLLY